MMEKRTRKYKRNRRAAGSGSVRLKNRAWHLQYRSEDGRIKSVKLCEKNDTVYFSATCPAVRELADAKLAELRPNAPDPLKDDIRISDFWENVYLAWAKNTNPKAGEPNLRCSTLTGYQQIWNQHLKPKVGEKTLQEYRTSDATQLLTELAKTQGRNTLNHIR